MNNLVLNVLSCDCSICISIITNSLFALQVAQTYNERKPT